MGTVMPCSSSTRSNEVVVTARSHCNAVASARRGPRMVAGADRGWTYGRRLTAPAGDGEGRCAGSRTSFPYAGSVGAARDGDAVLADPVVEGGAGQSQDLRRSRHDATRRAQ